MKIIDVVQGSELWNEHRRTHRNASDAPAMMGCSPYMTRNELLHALHTGVRPEPDEATQRRFAEGHRTEALARPLAEQILGEDLYAITVAEGRLSASLDGATLDGQINFEHKRLNAELRAALPSGGANLNYGLPLHYRAQLEHQMHCSGAKSTLFMASEWSPDGELVDARHCIYKPDHKLRAAVLAGWAQFEQDLADFVPAEAAPVVAAAPQEHLPAVSVQLSGSLAVASNLTLFGEALKAFIARIPKKPSTDQEFVDTDAACKRLKEAEERLAQAENTALASLADVEAMRRMVANLRELARAARLASEKLVKERKEQIRAEEVARGRTALAQHAAHLAARFSPPITIMVPADFGGVIKGLKTLDSVRNAIDTELARAKIEANALADRVDANLKLIAAADAPHLFPDKAALAINTPDGLIGAVIAQRVAEDKAREEKRLEAERERVRTETEARMREEARQQSAAAQSVVPVTTSAGAVPTASAPPALVGRFDNSDATLVNGVMCLTTSALGARFGVQIPAKLLLEVGCRPHSSIKAGTYWAAADFPVICRALAGYFTSLGG